MRIAVIDGLRRWKDFSGRSNRNQFWWFYLFFLLMPLVCTTIALVLMSLLSLLNLGSLAILTLPFSYLYLFFVPAMITIQIRRMHDVGKSGWFILVPIYNFYLFVQPSFENGRNQEQNSSDNSNQK